MEHHLRFLRNLGIDLSGPNLVQIKKDEPRESPLRVPQIFKDTYSNIVRFFFDKHLYSAERNVIINEYERSAEDPLAQFLDFEKMNQPSVDIVKDEHFWTGFNYVIEAFRPTEPVHIVHYTKTILYPWPLSTSVEEPFRSSKDAIHYVNSKFDLGEIPDRKMNKHNLLNYVYDAVRPIVHNIKRGLAFTGQLSKDYLFPITAHFRMGLGKSNINPLTGEISKKIKNRLVWGVPMVLLIPECMFAWPLFRNYLDNGISPLLWNYPTVLGGWMKLFNEIKPLTSTNAQIVISADWSEFDHRVLFELMSMVFIATMSYYNWTHYQSDYLYHTNENTRFNTQNLINLYFWTVYATFSSPVIMPDGSWWIRIRNGLPSGMFRTQWMDSIINGIMIAVTLSECGFVLDKRFILKLLGDDSLSILMYYIPPDQRDPLLLRMSEIALRRFNAKLSLEASSIRDTLFDVELLGYKNYFGHAYRDQEKLLAQLLYPEGGYKFSQLMGRCIGIAWADLGRNPRLQRICRDIYEFLAENGVHPDFQWTRYKFDVQSGIPVLDTFDYYKDIKKRKLNKHLYPEPPPFPTTLEIQQYLALPYYRTKQDSDRYWPPEAFNFQSFTIEDDIAALVIKFESTLSVC